MPLDHAPGDQRKIAKLATLVPLPRAHNAVDAQNQQMAAPDQEQRKPVSMTA